MPSVKGEKYHLFSMWDSKYTLNKAHEINFETRRASTLLKTRKVKNRKLFLNQLVMCLWWGGIKSNTRGKRSICALSVSMVCFWLKIDGARFHWAPSVIDFWPL